MRRHAAGLLAAALLAATAGCASGSRGGDGSSAAGELQGTARLWLLPDSQLAVVALDTYGTTPADEVDRVVALLDAEDYQA